MSVYDVLIVEDDAALAEALTETLSLQGYQVAAVSNGLQALARLHKQTFKLVVSDVQMPEMDGLQLLQQLRKNYAQIPVLLMTAYGTIPKAVEAMQSGAVDYLIKPFDAETLTDKVEAFIDRQMSPVVNVATNNEAMKRLYAITDKVARTDVTVLLQGESGTGKEVLARYIHRHSHYHNGPFIAINCAAIPENMLEAILFGYEKGAYTGAVNATPGKFEQAQGGTLLLDEISEMELALQAKLLRVLQEKEVERLGGQKKIKLQVRVLATTNRQLKQYVEEGKFREDLYYRLSVFPLKIPPLRERLSDVLPLAQEFIAKHHQSGKTLPRLDQAAVDKLLAYDWPGNVRELENVVQRSLILQRDGVVTVDELVFDEQQMINDVANYDSFVVESAAAPLRPESSAKTGGNLDESVKSAEEQIILQTLSEANGSRKMTAAMLGISPRTLRYKLARMKESGIAVPC